MTRWLLSVALLLLSFMHAAEAGSLRLGDMTLAYDAARWRVQGAVTMQPIGDIARELDPVRVSKAPARRLADCEALGAQGAGERDV